jgi:hypothetical protein
VAAPPSNESARETPVRQLDGGGCNVEEKLGLGSNHTGKAYFYRGIQSTLSQGRLWGNPSSNRFKITILEIGFDKGIETNLTEELGSVGIRPSRSDRGSEWSDHHNATRPAHGLCVGQSMASLGRP